MKKIIFVIFSVFLSVAAFAQRGIPRSGETSVSATIVIKSDTIIQKRGFQQSVELGTRLNVDGCKGATGVHYIRGYRINNHFFVGMGIGLEFFHYYNRYLRPYVGYSAVFYAEKYAAPDILGRIKYPTTYKQTLNLVAVPFYLHIKGYYAKTKWAPYSSLSFGGSFAPKENGLYVDFSTGVDVWLNAKTSFYLAAGVWLRGGTRHTSFDLDIYDQSVINYDEREDCHDTSCRYYNTKEEHSHIYISNMLEDRETLLGLSLRVGVSF